MYIYNVTVTIEPDIHEEWLEWMRTKHIPDVMKTGHFTENRICRVLSKENEITYALQYHFRKMEDLQTYQKDHAPRLQQEVADRYQEKFAAFRTVLEII